ncbi:putative ATP/GTP-binding protein [Ophiobolus disseminans]|uniref:Putative ATP/GTP-binding protein n=1 Tax=Ophiobolus disseminans TaxID=1469910 RepID=A0A6A6ZNQ7_9PLEO|nr:putative ATP/GTP-binding protein [Ophiobolus disseminans]
METTIKNLLASHLQRTLDDDRPIVVMTCGIAGAGKTTLAKAIEATYPAFTRISIDDITCQNHGIYGIDYEASAALYEQYQDEADITYRARYRALLADKKDVILERSFYAREDREEYRKMAHDGGARVVLVFLKAEGDEGKEFLWNRICKRSNRGKTADSALDISRETFEMYWRGFEDPVGEGEIVVKVG